MTILGGSMREPMEGVSMSHAFQAPFHGVGGYICIYLCINETPETRSQGGKLASPPGAPGSKSGAFCDLDFCICFSAILGSKMASFWGAIRTKIVEKRAMHFRNVFLLFSDSFSCNF